ETASYPFMQWERISQLYNLSLLIGSSGTPSVTCDLRVTTGSSPSDRARSVSIIDAYRRRSTASASVTPKMLCPASSFTTTTKITPVAIRHFVFHDVGQGFLSLSLGRLKVPQLQPDIIG